METGQAFTIPAVKDRPERTVGCQTGSDRSRGSGPLQLRPQLLLCLPWRAEETVVQESQHPGTGVAPPLHQAVRLDNWRKVGEHRNR